MDEQVARVDVERIVRELLVVDDRPSAPDKDVERIRVPLQLPERARVMDHVDARIERHAGVFEIVPEQHPGIRQAMRGYVLYDGSHHELVAEVLRSVPSGYKDPSFTCWKSLQGRDLGIHISSGVFFKIRLRLGLADRPMHVGARRALLRSEVHAGLHLLLE